MKISNLGEFQNIVKMSNGCVWMQDKNGLEYDLKSESGMKRVVSLLGDPNNDLELFASDPNATFRLISFLRKQKHTA